MTPIESIILGAVQGLTEFLPISSSAHLVLAPYFMHFEDPGLAYDVALHMGSLLAILLFFWREWAEIVRDFFRRDSFRLSPEANRRGVNWKLLVISTVPGAAAGLTLEKYAEHAFRNPLLIALTLALFALVLWYFDRTGRKNREISGAGWRDALVVGCSQALAIIPGVSRSGITITAGLLLGFARPSAVRFSFLLSAPIIAGAGVVKMKYILHALATGGQSAMLVTTGFAASLISSLAAIGLLTYIVRGRTFNVFVVYRLLLATAIIGVVLLR